MGQDLNDLRYFLQVAEAGGYAAASRATGAPRATLSRRIAALETALGQRLIERTSRSFRLTAGGEALRAAAAPMIAGAEAAIAALEEAKAEPAGQVTLAVAPSVLQLHLDRMLAEYLMAHPKVRLRVISSNRRIDPLRDGVDFVIRAGDPGRAAAGLTALPLARVEHVLALAPALAEDLRPTLHATLERIAPLAWAGEAERASWRLRDAGGAEVLVALKPRLMVEDMAALKRAVRAGLGLALLPEPLIREDLAEGRLIAASLDLRPPAGRIHALHTGSQGMRPAVRSLLDWLARAYGENCSAL